MTKNFEVLGIALPILRAIKDLGFEEPTEVQRQAIPHVLKHNDLIAVSKTGSGKTAVFGVPLLQLSNPSFHKTQALILTPTRELAIQVDSDLKDLAKYLDHRTTAVFGQHSMPGEIQALKRRPTIVTGTPGRVFDHIRHKNLWTKDIHFLVLDEADRMLDMGFIDQVRKIIERLPKDRVTLLFSATFPTEIRRIAERYMKNPVTIEIASETMTVDTVEQLYYRVDANQKHFHLDRLLQIERPKSCMVFCNTKHAVDRLHNYLTRKGYAAKVLHGDIPQKKRMQTIEQFKGGRFNVLVATDVAARGIHIDGLTLVINYDVPLDKDSYVHRIGRTARSGQGGRAISLVTSDDIFSLYEIEEHIGTLILEGKLPSDELLKQNQAKAKAWMKNDSPSANYPSKRSPDNRPGSIHQGTKWDANRSLQRQKKATPKSPLPKKQVENTASEASPEPVRPRKSLLKRILQRIIGH